MIVGASGGIGLAFVSRLLLDPNIENIYATYRDPISAVALLNIESPKVHCYQLDISQQEQIAQLSSYLLDYIDRLHMVINCVGILHQQDLQPEKSLQQINAENLLTYFQINSIASVLLAKYLLPLLRHEQRSILATLSAKVGSIGDNKLGG